MLMLGATLQNLLKFLSYLIEHPFELSITVHKNFLTSSKENIKNNLLIGRRGYLFFVLSPKYGIEAANTMIPIPISAIASGRS